MGDNKSYLTENSDTGSGYEIKVSISDNYYQAFITIIMYDEDVTIAKEDILKELNDKQIVYGIDNELIDDIVSNPNIANNLLIAKGTPHSNGVDGKLNYKFNIDNLGKPIVLEDGRVDHKNINYVYKVKKGDILAEKSPATPGKNGTTVTGRTIKAKPGKPVEFKFGKNLITSKDGMYLLAKEEGLLDFVEGKISVIKVLEIDSDVGISTGNISFNGKIVIKGNVEAGYSIHGDSDVEIFGIVENAEISAKENIIIHKGVHNRSRLISGKNIASKFIDNSYIYAGKDIICDTIMHCNIVSSEKVIANEKKGLIVGGNIKAKKEIHAKNIGSKVGTLTKLEAGIDDELINEYKNTKDAMEETKKNIDKLKSAINILNKQSRANKDNSQVKDLLNKSSSSKHEYISKLNNLEKDLKRIYSTIETLKKSTIKSNTIFPGVKIRLNNSHFNVKDILHNVALIDEGGSVKTYPLN